MHPRSGRRSPVAPIAAVAAAAALVAVPGVASARDHSHATTFQQINLVSDQPGQAQIMDPNLVNAWGMSRSATSPVWVSDNGKDVATLYRGAVGSTPVSAVPLIVSIPGGAPTGQVNNDTTAFQIPGTTTVSPFIFAGEHGDISAWPGAGAPSAINVGHVPGAVYKGLALVHSPFGPLLLATDFHGNRVEVYDSTFTRLHVGLLFRDSRLPRGYAPFNVAEIGDRVFVTYAKQDADREDDVAGRGHGFIDVFTNYGVLLHRFASRGVLDSPWGLTVAPASFGTFAGDLLVGNFGDGRIHAYDLRTGHLEGTLSDKHHHAIVIDGLWGLLVGDDAAGGADSVWFSAGPNDEAHGLLGLLRAG